MAAAACVFCKKTHDYTWEDAVQILRKTPDTLRELLDGVSGEAFNQRKGKEWSARQLMIHFIDTEILMGYRWRLMMAEQEPAITPVDQDLWNNTFQYGDLDATQLIRAFTPIRRVNVEMLETVDPALFDKKAKHPEFGAITVRMYVPHIAGHDLNHLQQIRERVPAV